ncbi:MAG TPA: hypothetical protein VF698_18415 [Thermoanaerobaculia bacterium]|jgi:hypothetical protein
MLAIVVLLATVAAAPATAPKSAADTLLEVLAEHGLASLTCNENPALKQFDCNGTTNRGHDVHLVVERLDGGVLNIVRINGKAPAPGVVTLDPPPSRTSVVLAKIFNVAVYVAVLVCPIVALTALVKFLGALTRNELARLPFVPQQKVTVPAPGSYILALEGPRFTWVAGIRYRMLDPRGAEVESTSGIGGLRTSGITHVRQTVRRFLLRNGGEHTLLVEGSPSKPAELALILSRPLSTGEMLWLPAMILSFMGFMGSLILIVAANR